MLEVLRAIACLMWALCFVAFLGNAWRSFKGNLRRNDHWMSVFWVVSAVQFGWGVRNVTVAPPLNGAAFSVTCGLLVLQCLLACILLHKKFQYEGWRW